MYMFYVAFLLFRAILYFCTPITSSMTTPLLILAILLLSIVLFFLFRISQQLLRAQQPETDANLFLLLQQQLQDMKKTVEEKTHQTEQSMRNTETTLHRAMQDQFGQSQKLIQGITGQSHRLIMEITEKLTTLDKTNQQVIGFSEQLQNLEKVLTHQKQRGALGESGLRMVLENILPPNAFTLQYRFEDGSAVDAAIHTKEGIITVDAKFSLDNYQRLISEERPDERERLEKEFKQDLKKRIDETAKYIKPKEGTLDFAFMFIPAEAIYYDLLINEVGSVKVNTRSLIEYAFSEKKVIIVSPTTFAAYLQTVLQGLRAFKIEEGAKTIRKHVEQLSKHIAAYEEYMKKLGLSMGTTVNHYNAAYKELAKIDKDIVKITEGERVIDPQNIEKPILGE